MDYQIATKRELRKALTNKVVREVAVGGTMTDPREVQVRMADGTVVNIAATRYGTLRIAEVNV